MLDYIANTVNMNILKNIEVKHIEKNECQQNSPLILPPVILDKVAVSNTGIQFFLS